jgi:hypothetical protein
MDLTDRPVTWHEIASQILVIAGCMEEVIHAHLEFKISYAETAEH